MRLDEAKRVGRLADELERPCTLLIVDEVGYIPFGPEAASLFFSLISSRYERSPLLGSSNKSFSAWAEIFGDAWLSPPSSTGWFATQKCSSSKETPTA